MKLATLLAGAACAAALATAALSATTPAATPAAAPATDPLPPVADNFNLMVRDAKGTRTIIDIAKVMASHGGKPYAINYILAAPDGSKVAAGLSEGGSEDASISVYDAGTGARIAGPIDRAQF